MSATTLAVDKLFTPCAFGSIEIKNRIVMAPMTRSKSPNNVPNPTNVEYYRRRAAGGVGLIISEGTTPGQVAASGYPDVPAFAGADALAGWKAIVDAVHAQGAKMIPQLWHVGSIRQPGNDGPEPDHPGIGPSAIVHPYRPNGVAPIEMTDELIAECIDAFATSAAAAKEIGFDGVELHGAHSYLIDQFFWEVTNQRTDGYGGELASRTRFGVELVAAVRAAVGPEFPICFRYSQWKQADYRHKMATNPKELEAFLTPLSDAGVDVFHASTRRFNEPEFEGSNLNLAGWSKKITGKAAVTVGSIGLDSDFLRSYAGKEAKTVGIDELIERMNADEFDFAAVGRALLADPEWPRKLAAGRESEIIPFEREHMETYP